LKTKAERTVAVHFNWGELLRLERILHDIARWNEQPRDSAHMKVMDAIVKYGQP
jgi:hypothetical protein